MLHSKKKFGLGPVFQEVARNKEKNWREKSCKQQQTPHKKIFRINLV